MISKVIIQVLLPLCKDELCFVYAVIYVVFVTLTVFLQGSITNVVVMIFFISMPFVYVNKIIYRLVT